MQRLAVIGGGLAGCEAAWQAARRGVEVDLYEMRPREADRRIRPVTLPSSFAATRCAAPRLENAVGLLKEELARLDSLIVTVGARDGRSGRRRARGRSGAFLRAGRVAHRRAAAHYDSARRK